MIYSIGHTTIDSDKYQDQFAKCYHLPFMKELVDLSGCSLKEVRDFIDRVIHEEKIEVNLVSKEIQDYCLAEMDDET
jgi:hypothetical protein